MRGIYGILNKVNGKMYVGSAQKIEVRWREHRYMLRTGTHHSPYLQRAWGKYGEDAFIFQVLEHIDSEPSLREAEQRWMDFYNTCGRNGYNAHPHAAGGQIPGWTPPPETLAKLSAACRGQRNGRARLTDDQVREIHARYVAGETMPVLAAAFNVGRSTVANITLGKTWKHLGLPPFHCLVETGKFSRRHRLTMTDVATIKERLARGESRAVLMAEYGVCKATIENIAAGRRKLPG